jgi:hypothetical protein
MESVMKDRSDEEKEVEKEVEYLIEKAEATSDIEAMDNRPLSWFKRCIHHSDWLLPTRLLRRRLRFGPQRECWGFFFAALHGVEQSMRCSNLEADMRLENLMFRRAIIAALPAMPGQESLNLSNLIR